MQLTRQWLKVLAANMPHADVSFANVVKQKMLPLK